jgi:O-antigen ligase
MGIASYIIFISGSRSSYLCVIVSFIIVLVKNKAIHPILKVATTFAIIYATLFFIQDEKSAIYNRIEKTEMQLESGEESRVEMAILSISVVMKEGTAFFHGVGFDNTENAIYESTGIELNKAIHNSYLQIFIEGGIFVFVYFLAVFVIYTLSLYIYYDVRKFVFFPTLIIISFFESNYGAGQFLFFPWMFFMVYYIHYNSIQTPVDETTG